jgi:hypothetical protein
MKRPALFSVLLLLASCEEKTQPKKKPAPVLVKPKNDSQPIEVPNTQPETGPKTSLTLARWKQVNEAEQTKTEPKIAFGNDTYVVVGNGETILISSDSIIWDPVPNKELTGAVSIAFGANTFVVVGQDKLYHSSNGKDWSEVKDAPIKGNNLRFLHETFVKSDEGVFYFSKDGLSWQETKFDKMSGGSIAYGAGVFTIAYTKKESDNTLKLHSLTSKDMLAWEETISDDGSGGVVALEYTNELFVLLGGSGQVLTSKDGKAWNQAQKIPADPATKVAFEGFTLCNDRLLANAHYPDPDHDDAIVASSTDAKLWSIIPYKFGRRLTDFACGEGVIVAVGVGGAIFIAKS